MMKLEAGLANNFGRSSEPVFEPQGSLQIALVPKLDSILMEIWPWQPSGQMKSHCGHTDGPWWQHYPVDCSQTGTGKQ